MRAYDEAAAYVEHMKKLVENPSVLSISDGNKRNTRGRQLIQQLKQSYQVGGLMVFEKRRGIMYYRYTGVEAYKYTKANECRNRNAFD